MSPVWRRSLAFVAAACAGCGGKKVAPVAPAGPAPVEQADVGPRAPRPASARPPVIWVALDGLDPDEMARLSAEGRVPNWSALVRQGATMKLSSFIPMLSPIVWTTEATGVGPDVHRVLDFEEIEPGTGRRVPVSGLSRAVPAVWDLASAAGKTVGVVGWWATHPAEVVHGFFISDRASPLLFDAPASGAAYPPALDARVRAVADADGHPRIADLRPYLSISDAEISRGLASPDGMRDPVFALGRILASTRVNQRLARDLYDRERPDFTTVYFEGTDEIGHVFASYGSPLLPCVSAGDAGKYGAAAERYFAAIDTILGQWMRRAREDGATLLVTSDHGFKWGGDRPCGRPSGEWSTAAFWHRPDGVFAAWGARVRAGRDAAHPTVFDVAPTVLALLDLPPRPDMPGKPIREAFSGVPSIPAPRAPETLRVERVAAAPVSAAEAAENTKKLVALGYLSAKETTGDQTANRGDRPGLTAAAWNNLGLYEREAKGDLAAAERDFRKALETKPGYHSPLFNLAILYRREGHDAVARDFLFQAIRAGHADSEGTILAWAGDYRDAKKPSAELALLREAAARFPASEPIARALGDALFREHDCEGARSAVARFSEGAREPETLNALGLYETCLGHRDRAAELFHRSLAMKPGQPGVIEALRVLAK